MSATAPMDARPRIQEAEVRGENLSYSCPARAGKAGRIAILAPSVV
jgi:hypothetical protein